MLELDKSNFDEKIVERCVVDFYQSDCPTCEKFAPVFEKVSKEIGAYKFYKVNLDDDLTLAERYSISHIPTIITFNNSTLQKTASGYMSEENFLIFLESEVNK